MQRQTVFLTLAESLCGFPLELLDIVGDYAENCPFFYYEVPVEKTEWEIQFYSLDGRYLESIPVTKGMLLSIDTQCDFIADGAHWNFEEEHSNVEMYKTPVGAEPGKEVGSFALDGIPEIMEGADLSPLVFRENSNDVELLCFCETKKKTRNLFLLGFDLSEEEWYYYQLLSDTNLSAEISLLEGDSNKRNVCFWNENQLYVFYKRTETVQILKFPDATRFLSGVRLKNDFWFSVVNLKIHKVQILKGKLIPGIADGGWLTTCVSEFPLEANIKMLKINLSSFCSKVLVIEERKKQIEKIKFVKEESEFIHISVQCFAGFKIVTHASFCKLSTTSFAFPPLANKYQPKKKRKTHS